MNRSQWLWRASMACAATLLILSGCDALKTDEFRWLAPDLLVRPPKNPRVSLIRRSITPADERTDLVPNATPPTEDDFTYTDKDYVLGPTDLIDVAIMDLYQVGVETTLRREVSDAGYIDLPLLPHRIKAQGLTQEELRETIKAAFSPAILRDPIISVSVVSRRQNMFSVLGAVLRGGTYNILRKDMRMLEALALVGDVTEPTTQYIYVLRMMPVVPVPDANAPREGQAPTEMLGPLPEPIPRPQSPATKPSTTQSDLDEIHRLMPGPSGVGPPRPAPGGTGPAPLTLPAPSAMTFLTDAASTSSSPAADEAPPAPRTSPWMFINGRWVRVNQPAGATPSDLGTAAPSGSRPWTARAPDANAFEYWLSTEKKEMCRVIAINYVSLQKGDARMNIVIKDNDVIFVPRAEQGEFYIGGQVQRPGVYSLTARLVTVKMAVTAAGNLSPDSWPRNSTLTRRIGDNQEQVIPLDIEAIFFRQVDDLYLKPNDVIAVGSSAAQPFITILRNAFRFSYGFGFVYDRNFSDAALGSAGRDSRRFSRW